MASSVDVGTCSRMTVQTSAGRPRNRASETFLFDAGNARSPAGDRVDGASLCARLSTFSASIARAAPATIADRRRPAAPPPAPPSAAAAAIRFCTTRTPSSAIRCRLRFAKGEPRPSILKPSESPFWRQKRPHFLPRARRTAARRRRARDRPPSLLLRKRHLRAAAFLLPSPLRGSCLGPGGRRRAACTFWPPAGAASLPPFLHRPQSSALDPSRSLLCSPSLPSRRLGSRMAVHAGPVAGAVRRASGRSPATAVRVCCGARAVLAAGALRARAGARAD